MSYQINRANNSLNNATLFKQFRGVLYIMSHSLFPTGHILLAYEGAWGLGIPYVEKIRVAGR